MGPGLPAAKRRTCVWIGALKMWEIWEFAKSDPPTIVGLVAGAILWAFVLGLKLGEKIWR